ncbi:MAG: GNAT family N-acetyltransferase [Clostridia bacterium]|nr:GNAT family N-acetyltransferase [Clostridia bacterium]
MISIREARISDVGRITEIYNWAIINTTATFDLDEQTVDKRMEWFEHYGGRHPLIVAEADGKIVGYSSLSKFRDKEAYARTVEVSVYIDPEYHGKGIGSILLKEIIERGRQLGHHVIMAGITAGNDVSVRLHEKFGFVLCGHFKELGFKFNKWQDVLFYQLTL